MLSDQQREQMRAELRRAGFRDEGEIRLIVDLAERHTVRRTDPTMPAAEWRRLFAEAPDRRSRAALVVSRHLEGWLTAWLLDGERLDELEDLTEQELRLLELEHAPETNR